jgi:hypothetical protein
VTAVPTAQEKAAAQQPHIAPTAAQTAHIQEAAKNPALAAKTNGGHPAIAATARPGAFSGPGVIGARGAIPPAAAKPPAPVVNPEPRVNQAAELPHAPTGNGAGTPPATNPPKPLTATNDKLDHPPTVNTQPSTGKPPAKLAKVPPPKPKPKAKTPPKPENKTEGEDKGH